MKMLLNLNPHAAERRTENTENTVADSSMTKQMAGMPWPQDEIKKSNARDSKEKSIDYVLSVSNSTALKLAPRLVNSLFTSTQ